MIQVYDFTILALAASRVASSIAGDEIFRPVRNWVYLRSAPVDDQLIEHKAIGDEYFPARMAVRDTPFFALRDEWHGGNDELRTPGFIGKLISCPVCLSFWVTLFWLAIYLASAHWAIILATPFAIWSAAVALVHYTSR